MQPHSLVADAAAPTITIIHGIAPDRFDAPTPCSEWNVRGLIEHLLFWGPSLEGAAAKELVSPPAEGQHDVDLAGSDWAARLEAQTNRIVASWSDPGAWDGMTRMGSPMEMPAATIGGMVLGELIVHGWDLARATGQRTRWSDEVLELTYDMAAKTAEQGREMGVYGSEIPVPDTAPLLDRLVGLTGRDPGWTA